MARLELMNFPELNESVLEKLQSRNIYNVYDFMSQTCDNIIAYSGLKFQEIQNMKKSILKKFGGEVMNSINTCKLEKSSIMTGIENLDSLLEGGLHYRRIYEICGSSSSGKSQLCHWISTYTTVNTSTQVHYIDGSKNFCISRIQMILEAKECSEAIIAKVMSNIKVYQTFEINDLLRIFHHLSRMPNENSNTSSKMLIIVDSLSVLCAKIESSELNPILSNFASVCRYLVNNFHSIVIITNTIKFESRGTVFNETDKKLSPIIKPSLGNYWLCIPNVRLLMSCLKNTQRELCVWNSSQLENGKKCIVTIQNDGIS